MQGSLSVFVFQLLNTASWINSHTSDILKTFPWGELVSKRSLWDPPESREEKWGKGDRNESDCIVSHLNSYRMAIVGAKMPACQRFVVKEKVCAPASLTCLTLRQISCVYMSLLLSRCTYAVYFTLCPHSPTVHKDGRESDYVYITWGYVLLSMWEVIL